MAELRNTAESARLHQLIREAEQAKRPKKDRWGLTPIEKGWVRGHVVDLRQWDEPCEFGILQIMEFDLREDKRQPGIRVRMSGTYFNTRLLEGSVIDVPDPTPSVRPMTPNHVFTAHNNREHEISAYYPGRGAVRQRSTLIMALLATIVPAAVVLVIFALMHYVLHAV